MTKKLWIIFAVAFLGRLILSFIVWHPDINNHIDWGIRFWQYGPAKFFAPETNVWSYTWPNQPPGTIYMFAGIRKLFEFIFNIFWVINIKIPAFPSGIVTFFESNLYSALLKLPSILADIGIAYLLYKLTKKTWAAVLWLINPVVWYNSAVWGQTDAIISFLSFLAFYLLVVKKKVFWAVLALVLCFYVKISLFIFLPIFLIVLVRQKYPAQRLVVSVVGPLLLIGVLTLPFSQGEPFSWLLSLYQNKVLGQQLQVITANAFNFWAGIAGIHERPQVLPFLGLTYQYWGYILSGLSFLPILYSVWKKQDQKTVIWALALTAFSSWMLLTNMHERYLYPLFPYLTALVFMSSVGMVEYWAISLISLLNLYNFWWVPEVRILKEFLSFGDRLMPRILGAVNFILYLLVYIKGYRQNRLGRKSD
ncbi:MAG: hypothetical protein AAB656_03635 [Patescibacteria group bacterium]